MKQALYPGTFDPLTFGHLDLIERGAKLCDELLVGVGDNGSKSRLFTADERVEMLEKHVAGIANVRVAKFSGLVVDFARSHGITVLLRGLRTVVDFEYEQSMALTNRALDDEIDSVFLMPSERWTYLSSSLIKEVMAGGGDATQWLPEDIAARVAERLRG